MTPAAPPFRRGQRLLAAAAAVAVAVALWQALAASPPDEATGERVRMLYVHVGAAWTAYLAYGLTALGAAVYLWRRQERWDWLAIAAAEWGVVLTTVTLVSGSLWGKAVNGWWWVWADVRLTLTLLLWFLYVGYLLLRRFAPGSGGAVASAVLALLGVPLMVLNHFAVRLWQVAHPPPIVVREGGAAADPAIVAALLASVVAYTLVFAAVLVMRIRLEALRAYQP